MFFPDTVQVTVKDKDGCNGERADTAEVIGNEGDNQQENPIQNHSWSPFCLITSLTGVPVRPETERT